MIAVRGWGAVRALAIAGTMWAALGAAWAQGGSQPAQKGSKTNLFDSIFGFKPEKGGGWLFAASRGEGEGGVYFAISQDGYHWTFVNDGKPVLRQTEKGEAMRDPFMQRGPDGTLRMVWSWSRTGAPPAIGYASSTDILHWTQHKKLTLMASVPGAATATSPATFYDAAKKQWIVLWTSSVAAGAPGGAAQDRIYATTTADFKQFAPAKVFFDPGYSVADATIVTVSASAQQYSLLFEDERANQQRIYAAKGTAMDGPWTVTGGPISVSGTNAPAAIPVDGGLLVFSHHFQDPEEYNADFTKDMAQWQDMSLKLSFPGQMRHGSFVRISEEEYNMLKDFYLRFDTGLRSKQ
jgi:hypothetical protein